MQLEVKNSEPTDTLDCQTAAESEACLELYCDTIQARKHSLEEQQTEIGHVSSSDTTTTGEGQVGARQKESFLSHQMSNTKPDSRRTESGSQSAVLQSPDAKTEQEHKTQGFSGMQTCQMSGAASTTKERPSRACKKGKDPRLKLCTNPDCTQKSSVRKRFCNKTGLYCEVNPCHAALCTHDRQRSVLPHLPTPHQSLGRSLDHL